MFVSKISYMKRRNLGNYEHAEVSVEVMNDTEKPVTAAELGQFAEEACTDILGRAKSSVPASPVTGGRPTVSGVQDTAHSGHIPQRAAPQQQRYGGNQDFSSFQYEVNMPFIRNKVLRDSITQAMKEAGYRFHGERSGGNNHWYGNSPVLHPDFDDKWYVKSPAVGGDPEDDVNF